MKRLIIPGLILLAALALFYGGNRILARVLDAQLPELLTRELGIPVTLAPTRIRIATLTVHTPKLVMGDPGNPALVASQVSISLAWPDLLHGEIRLRSGRGGALVVKPYLWPGNDNPWPADYRFLDPYLPDSLTLDSASYVGADGDSYTFTAPVWRRQSPGATLNWQDHSSSRAVDVTAGLQSLEELLRLERMDIQLSARPHAREDSAIDLALGIKPAKTSGYSLNAKVSAAGMSATVDTGNGSAWQFPDRSTTSIEQIDLNKLRALVAAYSKDETGDGTAQLLASALPRLSLPNHRGNITVGEIRWHDEVGTANSVDFITGPKGVTIPGLSSKGAEGLLRGQLSIASTDKGWQLTATADVETAGAGESLGAPYMDVDWFWREGSGKLTGQGDTWGTLLNSLQGDIALSGYHRGTVQTPVSITARLDNRPGEVALDSIEVKVADGRISGSAALSGDTQKRLKAKISAEQLKLDFLLPESDTSALPGIELPTYLEILPGVDLDMQLDITALQFSSLNIAGGDIIFTRTQDKADLAAHLRGTTEEVLSLKLDALMFPDKPSEVSLRADLSRFSISQLFKQAPLIPDSRTSGIITFSSRGDGMEQIFRSMRGDAKLSIDRRPDQDWKRAPIPNEQLDVSGQAVLVVENQRITGLQISELAVDSRLQNLTGSISLVQGRKPWLEAELTSETLDLDKLAELTSQDATDGASPDSLDSLRRIGDSRVSLKAKSLLVAKIPLSNVALSVSTAPDSVKLEQLDFSLQQGRVTSGGGITWQKNKATLSLDAKVLEVNLDQLLLAKVPAAISAPLSGTVSLRSAGSTTAALLGNLSGEIQLTSTIAIDSTSDGTPAQIHMTAGQTADGMQAEIHRFLWDGTDLAGTVRYRSTSPPVLEIEIDGGSLSLLPWEAAEAAAGPKDNDKKEDVSDVSKTARVSAELIGDVVMAPLRLIAGPREAKPGDKLFSSKPLPVEWLTNYQAGIKGKLDSLTSREASASDLEFSASLNSGRLNIEASVGTLNKGSAFARMAVDVNQQPPSVELSGTFKDLRGDLIKAGFARSGYFDLTSTGGSQAELAANANGLVYLELGAGPLDYTEMMLLTADVASAAFNTLIPGADKTKPQLECGVTLAVFKDGMGTTPYGYAARTNLANLVGRIDLDLKKELLHLSFSSSSRKGVGFSIGNVFSNTVEIEGALTDPKIIPNATGLLWRSWAAVMTGGLSVVGESVLKRALASENPCTNVQKHIRKDLCATALPAATSPLVCPPAQ